MEHPPFSQSSKTENLNSKHGSIDKVRNQLVNATIFTMAILGVPATIFSIYRSVDIGWQPPMVFHLISTTFIIIASIFYRKIHFAIRASLIISICFLTGTAGLFTFGLIGHGSLLLTAACILSTILFGFRFGIITLICSATVFIVTGLLVHSGNLVFNFHFETYAFASSSWLSAATIYSFITLILVAGLGKMHISLTTLINNLNNTTSDLEQINKELARSIIEQEQSENKYKQLIERMNDGFGLLNKEGVITYANKRLSDMLGYNKDELIGNPVVKFFDEKNLIILKKQLSLRKLGDNAPYEIEWTRRNGTNIPVMISPQLLLDENGQNKGSFAVITDITHRKQVEETLQSEKDLNDAIIESLPGLFYMFEKDTLLFFRRSGDYVGITGFSDDELDKMTALDCLADKELCAKKMGEVFDTGVTSTMENAVILKSGKEPIPYFFTGSRLIMDDKTYLVGLCQDISERTRAEKELKDSEEKFRSLFESSPVGIAYHRMIYDDEDKPVDFLFLNANDNYIELAGVNPCNKTVTDAFPGTEKDPFHWIETFGEVAKDGKTIRFQQYLEHNDRWYDVVGFQNLPNHFVAAFLEITEQKRAEKEILNLRNYLSNIIDSMPSLLVGVDNDGKVTQWNKKAEQITGINTDTAQGKTLPDVFPQMASEMKKITESIKTKKIKQEQKRPHRQNGETHYEDLTVYPLIANGVEGVVIRIDDVTEQVRMEEMMIQSEKMLSVGGLAAGMAHEINNPLAGMMQTADVMNDRLTDMKMPANRRIAEEVGINMEGLKAFMEKRGILRMIATINESGHRVADIVNNMLSFARKSDSSISFYHLADLLDKTLELAATDYDLKKQYDFKTIKIVKEYEVNLPPVPCEGAKVQQVLLNILRNGAQAMQDAETEKPLFIIRTWFEKKRKMVCIEIGDNGHGMEKDISKRIFEPFFTTKSVGVGTGLGLSVSYFIITESHNGELAVESRPGLGAKFIIRLPLEGQKA